METLTMEQAADYLEDATIESTMDSGYAIAHNGFSPAGVKFILFNDMFGHTTLTESL